MTKIKHLSSATPLWLTGLIALVVLRVILVKLKGRSMNAQLSMRGLTKTLLLGRWKKTESKFKNSHFNYQYHFMHYGFNVEIC